jgi:Protein of unknown function (DUF3617)
MHTTRIWITLFCCLFAMSVFAAAQTRKPGLWELTTNMTWQQSPFPAGMGAPPAGGGGNSPFGGGPHTTEVCFTQQQIDKYGAIVPQTSGCQVTNVVKKTNSMTADMVCSGRMNGKGSMESSWTDDQHATGKIHFVGSMQLGPNSKPIEWTTTSTSFYKSADCGAVKPIPVADK